MSLFSRIVTTIVLLLLAVFIMFFLFNRYNQNFMKQELHASAFNRLVFFQQQMDTTLEQFSKMAFTLKRDPDAIKFQVNRETVNWFNVLDNKNVLAEKINLQSSASAWSNYITIYAPQAEDYVGTNNAPSFDPSKYEDIKSDRWTFRENDVVFHSIDPMQSVISLNDTNIMVEVGLPLSQISEQLNHLKLSSGSDPFYYHSDYGVVANTSGNMEWIEMIVTQWDKSNPMKSGSSNFKIAGEELLVHYTESELLGGYFVDYTPLNRVFQSLHISTRYFYILSLMLLFIAIAMALLLYQNVQSPIKELIRGVEKLQAGKFAIRIRKQSNREFDYLFDQFNLFSSQIQELIEKNSFAKVQVMDARLKQLQSQINPHFLYNCLAFIQSTAQLGNTNAVVAMAQNLGRYYRFTTQVDDQSVKLAEEMELVSHYLHIQKLQLHRLTYEMSLSDSMTELMVPRLILQPLVENAVLHGIERTIGPGFIRISTIEHEHEYVITVEDNGAEVDEQLTRQLEAIIEASEKKATSGYGLRNIDGRLRYTFTEKSGLRFAISELGGLKVSIHMEKPH